MYRALVFIACALLLGGCTLQSKQEYEKMQEMLAQSSDLRRQASAECIEIVAHKPRKIQENAAKAINVSLKKLPSVFCKRLLSAITSGRLTYSELQIMQRTRKPTARFLKMMRG